MMSGRLPGVRLVQRKRREQQKHRYDYERQHQHYHFKESFQPPWIPPTLLDETALKARQSLHNKLRPFFSSYRSSENGRKEGKVRYEKKEGGIARKLLERSWLLGGKKTKKRDRKLCAVCLEDLGQEEEVMNLSCSHKYHSICLLPWLAVHPHCPYCRSPIQP